MCVCVIVFVKHVELHNFCLWFSLPNLPDDDDIMAFVQLKNKTLLKFKCGGVTPLECNSSSSVAKQTLYGDKHKLSKQLFTFMHIAVRVFSFFKSIQAQIQDTKESWLEKMTCKTVNCLDFCFIL